MEDMQRLQQFLEQATHMLLAVVLPDGRSWAVPVKIQCWSGREFEWDSKLDTLHSQALVQHADVAITIFTKEKGQEFAFYAKAYAKEVSRRTTKLSKNEK